MTDRITKVTLLAATAGYVAGFQQAKKVTDETATAADKAKAKLEAQSKILGTAGKAAAAFGTAAAIGVVAAVKAYAEWDAKMAQVRSLSHAGTADMQALSNQTFGFATKFGISASQAADAEIELTKGGVSVSDMIHGALSGALTLAAAGQIDVGDATSIAVSAMTQFHLKGQDVSHIADLLAAGADKALGSVSDLGQGLKYVGPVAASMGISLEQTVGTLSLLAQNGILADQAGTGLRGMLSSLTSPSQQAAGTMKQFGISVYDAKGNFVGFDGVAQELQTHLGGLDQATRAQALGQIFGNQQITAATILMNSASAASVKNKQTVDDWTHSVNDQGFAAQQAAGKLDSLSGRWTKLTAALQNDLVQTGEGAAGPLNAAVSGATKLVTAYGNLSQPMKNVVLDGTAAAAAIGLVGGAAILAVPRIVAFDAAIAAAGGPSSLMIGSLKSTTSFLLGPWGAALGVGVTATVLFNDALKVSSSTLRSLESDLESGKKSVDTYNEAFKANTSGNWAQDIKFSVQNTLTSLKLVNPTRDLKQFLDLAGDGTSKIRDFATSLIGLGTDGFAGTQQALKTLDTELSDTAQKSVPDAKQAFADLAKQQGLSKTQQSELMKQLPQYAAALKGAKKSTDDLTGATADAAAGASDAASAVDQVQQAAADASESVDDLVKQLEGLDNGTISASEAQVAMAQAVADATAAVKKNGATLDVNSQKGRDNKKALDNIASSALSLIGAQEQAGASTDTLSKSTASARSNFISVAQKMGLSAAAAGQLANQYGLVPSEVLTTIQASGVAGAIEAAVSVKNAVESIPPSRTINISVDGAGAKLITGGGTSPMIARAQGGILSYYANGGVRGEDHVAQIAPAGAMRLWAEPETGGESYIPLAPSKRSRSIAIWEETGRRLQAFAGGGITSPSITVSGPSLDGLAIGGRLEVDASGLMRLVDGRIYAATKADARATSNGRRRR